MAPNTVATASPTTNGSVAPALGVLTFTLQIPGVNIGYFAECSGLGVEYEVLEYPEGGNNEFVHRLRGRARYPPLVFGRGFTSEDALLKWFFDYQKNAQRPTVTVTVVDAAGVAVRRFAFASAFPIKWSGPTLSASGNDHTNESLEIGHMGLVP